MNILTQFSLCSIPYLIFIIASALYVKYGKSEKLKKSLKSDGVPIALVALIFFNVLGFVLWLGEIWFV